MTFNFMKHLNKILSEAIGKGINIALDDYEEDINNVQISSKKILLKIILQ